MSLDIMCCRLVRPDDLGINGVYWLEHHPVLRRLQSQGIICVKEERIGRSCLSSAWHSDWEETYDLYDPDGPSEPTFDEERGEPTVHGRMLYVFPGQEQEKLLSQIDLQPQQAVPGTAVLTPFFDEDALSEPWDFIFINW